MQKRTNRSVHRRSSPGVKSSPDIGHHFSPPESSPPNSFSPKECLLEEKLSASSFSNLDGVNRAFVSSEGMKSPTLFSPSDLSGSFRSEINSTSPVVRTNLATSSPEVRFSMDHMMDANIRKDRSRCLNHLSHGYACDGSLPRPRTSQLELEFNMIGGGKPITPHLLYIFFRRGKRMCLCYFSLQSDGVMYRGGSKRKKKEKKKQEVEEAKKLLPPFLFFLSFFFRWLLHLFICSLPLSILSSYL